MIFIFDTTPLTIEMKNKTIVLPNIGPVLFEQSKRAKHINISVKPPATIRVAIPRGISYKKAAKFARSKEIWIKKTLHKMNLRQKHSVNLEPVNRNDAKLYLLNRLDELARMHGFTYNKATIRNQKTRWGSCTPKTRSIRFNLELVKRAPECLEYIVVHELVHLLEASHNSKFKTLMDRFYPKWKFYRKELRSLPIKA